MPVVRHLKASADAATAISGEQLPGGKTDPGLLPAYPPQAAGEPRNTAASPAGPGKPIDGSPAVNTYTPRDVQAEEFSSGAQDWQSLVATPIQDVELPRPEDQPYDATMAPRADRPPPDDRGDRDRGQDRDRSANG